MATVYRARHTELGTVHAIKVVNSASSDLRQRLLLEGRSQGSLQHPNVLTVTDLVDVDGSPGLVLEFVDGPTLAEHLASRRLDIEEVDQLARQILAGMRAAHGHGLVHRDLKPSNVLLSMAGDFPMAKVADFGLVKALHGESSMPSRTRTGLTMGTPGYMAPEQIVDASTVDARTDVFALGAMLYEMLTGQCAFQGEDLVEVLQATKEGRYGVDDLASCQAPERMILAIKGSLNPAREERFEDCSALEVVWTGQSSSSRSWSPASPQETPSPVQTWQGHEEVSTLAPSLLEPEHHPSLETLLEGRGEATIEAHLAGCAPCRVELKLYEDAFESTADPVRPGGVRWAGPIACLASTPLVVGVMVWMAGGVRSFQMLGPFAFLILLFSILAVGSVVRVTLRQREGRARGPAFWLLFPCLVVVAGLVGSAAGFVNVQEGVDGAAPEIKGMLTAVGIWVALSAEGAGYGMGTLLLLFAAAAATLVHRSRCPGPPDRIGPLAAISLGAGTLLWATDGVLREDAPAPFLVLLVLVFMAGCYSLISVPSPADDRSAVSAKATIWVAGIGATTCAALGVHVAHQRRIFNILQDQMPSDALLAALRASELLSTDVVGMVAGWVLAACALVWISSAGGRGISGGKGLGPRKWLALVGLLIFMGGVYAFARQQQDATAKRIVPAYLAQSVAWTLPDVVLEVTGTEIAPVVLEAPEPLLAGDRIIAVGDRPVEDLGDLLSGLHSCLCEGAPQDAKCLLVDGCLSANTELALRVVRELPGKGPRHVEVISRFGGAPLSEAQGSTGPPRNSSTSSGQ